MADDKIKMELDFISGNYEHLLKTANYLLAAHGASLLLCLSVLKDYSAAGNLKGVGTFIVLFGIGLLAAIANYISLSLSRSVAMNAAKAGRNSDRATEGFLTRLHLISLAITLGRVDGFERV